MKDGYIFAAMCWMILAILGDVYTTSKGFSVGYQESNPIAAWIQKKIGLTLSGFLGGVCALGFIGTLIALNIPTIAFIAACTIAGIETTVAINNYRLYKKSLAAQEKNPKLK